MRRFSQVPKLVLAVIALIIVGGVGANHSLWAAPATQAELIPIYAIQGDDVASPWHNTRLSTYGVVTARLPDGFYLQDPNGDGNPNTSDGIFAYTGWPPTVTVGECIELNDVRAQEFYEKTELFEIARSAVRPSIQCGTAPVAAAPAPLPHLYADSVELYEHLEGMLIALDPFDGTVHGPTKRFEGNEAEIALVYQPWSANVSGERIFQWQADYTPALIFLNGALGVELPDVGWGDTLSVRGPEDEPVLAILDYNFGKYQFILLPGQELTIVDDRPFGDAPGPAATQQDFTLCTFNAKGLGRGSAQIVENDAYAAELRKRALAITESLQGCTIIGMQETGTPQDAQNLADLLRDEFQLGYTALSIAGPMTTNAEFPLTLSVLVRSERVDVLAVEQRQGCSATDYEVLADEQPCPPQEFPLFNRPPLVVDLAVRGDWGEPYVLTVIDNHWKSKGGDESVNLVRRKAQADHVASLVQEKHEADPAARVVVLGDLNDYYNSEPVALLRQATTPPLVHVFDHLPLLDRYTYNFNGASQVLDHILMTPYLAEDLAEVDPVHINADYPYPANVNLNSVHHSSDHDPVAVRIRPGGAGWIRGNVRFSDIRVRLLDANEQIVGESITDSHGHYRLWNLLPGEYTLRYVAPEHIELTTPEVVVQVEHGPNRVQTPDVAHRSVQLGAAAAQLTAPLGVYVTDE